MIDKENFFLTRREREVLDLLASGLTDKLIARRLAVSIKTVEAHNAAIYSKLEVREARLNRRVLALRAAFKRGLVVWGSGG